MPVAASFHLSPPMAIDVKYQASGDRITSVLRSWVGVEIESTRIEVKVKNVNLRTPEEIRTFRQQMTLAIQDWRLLSKGQDPRPPKDGSSIGGPDENSTQ